MWAGIEDFREGPRLDSVLHVPSGLVLEQPPAVPHGVEPDPEILTSISDPGFRIELICKYQFDSNRTDQGLTPEVYDELGTVGIRKKYGMLLILSRAKSIGTKPVVWNSKFLTDVLKIFFYRINFANYTYGEPPDPDRIEVAAPEIPSFLHGIYLNPFWESPK